ncbi:MAG: putative toxin-antitoxin system toxin component, PIN family [Burkholderiales bacterium]
MDDSGCPIGQNYAPAIERDPGDDAVLACALAANAQFIVSGDKDLLDIEPFQNILILSQAQTLAQLDLRD